MSNDIRPEDVRRIAAAKEREVLGEDGIRRFAEPSLDLNRGDAPPRTPYGTQSHGLPPAAPRGPVSRGPYDRGANPRAAFDRPAAPPPQQSSYPPAAAYPPVYERAAAPMVERGQPADEDFGMPPAYAGGALARDEQYYDEAPLRRRRLPMAVAAIALAGFGALVWYAYDWGTSGSVTGEAPVIKAAEGPDKVKPTEEGGIEVPNQEATVLNPGATEPTTETLMPPPEEPVTPPPPPAPAAPAPAAPSVTGTQPAVEEPAVVLSPAPAVEPVAAAAPPNPPPATAPQPVVPVAATAPVATGGATIAAGDFLIQLASLTSPEAAQTAWSKMQKTHPGLLGDMTVSFQEADITGKGKYWRVQAGPLPNRATADDMCAQLKAVKQDCIVVKR